MAYSPPQQQQSEPLKRRRITRACDRCHRSGVKCSRSPTPGICGPCAAFGSECTYQRPVKRRGPVPRALSAKTTLSGASQSQVVWKYESVSTPEAIETLVDAYHRIIYPILPFFHWPSFYAHIRVRRYMHDRAFYAVTMALCAITSARMRDGASFLLDAGVKAPLSADVPTSEAFYEAAIRTFPADLSQASEFDYKRAKVILAMLCIQFGNVRQLTTHLGDYMTLSSIDNFHLEARWPANLPETEVQERRRLFWGAYTIDVYAATTFGGVVRHREAQSTVLYPALVDDDEITERGIVPRIHGATRPSYLVGWNFTTDLYRILEHSLDQLRAKHLNANGTSDITNFFSTRSGSTQQEGLDLVAQLYAKLPEDFKGAKAMTGDMKEDRYGFQAADIMVTMQTVKMVMLGLEDATVERRCAVAGELLDALSNVPTAYIQAISSPIMHHLAGVGHLLGSVIQSPLSPWAYLQVRNVLITMANLVSDLETSLSNIQGIGNKLKDHVNRIDQYMHATADHQRRAHVYHSTLPPNAWGGSSGQLPQMPSSDMRAERPQGISVASSLSPESATPSWNNPSPSFSNPKNVPYPMAPDMFEFSLPHMAPDTQVQLPTDLFLDLSFEFGSEGFDFLSLGL
ncbi:hypothetical protein CcaverHIS002_0704590 [Cutaneotrichosporon cavernicola]|uniref:Zn(2)-C6 fungal-type domain-containing protein n=1 Tax=Cutaneotrichosporon cavernicola TaxID=279322 RepID=A0AA48LAI8_9TREE|nr:uncharacterized protein CcaverHIS019_0704670 [Cutaneotrichosporon cavernicola]BEI87113.1 hypothetical protein CcaverHIS002_0704590 [Cutaneotrichosporon cavernicola]BEI94886.1 hypothetical protein CcaverHIS019_0704670 [Cutaneotrichosporon cavernicola]BEJ02660.1 hypothetical protein CcaverHIS631_0704550 [Cutaneotrichosporon cavernicola]BEJ10416.1 hypothetical protein CcaverHIS641_0704510 [Cutaneotrichosporon cavernicola]